MSSVQDQKFCRLCERRLAPNSNAIVMEGNYEYRAHNECKENPALAEQKRLGRHEDLQRQATEGSYTPTVGQPS